MTVHTKPLLLALAAFTASFAWADGSSGGGTVAITAGGTAVTQDFNTLVNTGTGAFKTLPTGWYLSETGTGTSADGAYAVGDGSSNSGNSYSFGAASGDLDRALGSVGSGSVATIQYGAQFTNMSGGVITSLTVSYYGEMWRRGTTTAAAGDGLTFAYSASATSLSSGAYTNLPALNFVSPGDACSATQNTKTNGNSDNCRKLLTATITGLAIPNGASFWIRWTDVDTTGSDDGIAIDDVSVSATVSALSVNPSATGSATPATVTPGQTTTLSGTLTTGQNPASSSFTVVCNLSSIGGSASQTLPVTGSTFSFNAAIAPATLPNAYALPCSVTDDVNRSNSFTIGVTALLPLNAACGAPATPINAVQGPGNMSPLAGQIVDVEGIVVGSFQGSTRLNGFYLEEPPATQDNNPQTSEGLFVFANTPSVNAGDRVRIRGAVSEFASSGSFLTELGSTSNATVCSTNNPLPPPVNITLPVANVSDLERYEGMLVQFTQPLVVTGTFNLGSFGQIDLAPMVLFQPTQTPGNTATWAAATDLNRRSTIALDDASGSSNANLNGGNPAPYPAPGLSAANTLRVGALVNSGTNPPAPLTGILDDRFGAYRIEPTTPVTFSNAPDPRPNTAAVANSVGGRFKVASANVLNFFTTLGSRGAQTAQELTNQRTKIIAELSKLNADVYGISEVQNFTSGDTNGTYTNVALADLTTSLAAATGRHYRFIDTTDPNNLVGGDVTQNGTDAIRNVIIYDADTVMPQGKAALLYQNDQNRPSLAQTFLPVNGPKAALQTFTVVVNHFRSKSTGCGAGDDLYQGGCNSMRVSMANAVRNWLATNPTGDPAGTNRKVLLVGDFNAYFGEDPIQAFTSSGGYIDLIALLLGPQAYSYNFGSQSGYLDHALANAALLPLIRSVAELHVNADESAALEALHSSTKSPAAQLAYFAPDEFAASDHDPFVVGFNPLAGDLNDDGVVDLADRNLLVASYGKLASAVDRRIDFDGDGLITPNDYRIWFALFRIFMQ